MNIILRMGTFHTIMTLLAIIRKRFQDAGLRKTCIESGIIAEGSVSVVLEGRMAVRVHKIIHEALLRLAWKMFHYLVGSSPATPDALSQCIHCLIKSAMHLDKCPNRSLTNYSQLSSDGLAESLILWNQFLSYLRHDNGHLSTFWVSYVDMVGGILLRLIRTSGDDNWQLYLFAIGEMCPWYFAYAD